MRVTLLDSIHRFVKRHVDYDSILGLPAHAEGNPRKDYIFRLEVFKVLKISKKGLRPLMAIIHHG